MESIIPSERESYPADLYPQEQILKTQRDRQQLPLSLQRSEFETWYKQEKKLAPKVVLACTFSDSGQPTEALEYAKFFPGTLGGQMKAEILGAWNPAQFKG
jgi:hypothetical protein